MTAEPQTSGGYRAEFTDAAQSACLTLATILGDFFDDLIVVGGLVPGLLVDQQRLPTGAAAHVGTLDLDLGLALTVLHEARYSAIAERIRAHGFEQDLDESGRGKFRWRHARPSGGKVTVDFLIPPAGPAHKPGKLRTLEPGFVAIIAPALDLAFRDSVAITLTGTTLGGEHATRRMKVCGPGAFVAMKAHAFHFRGEPKDAYDLYYVLRNFGAGVADVAAHFVPLIDAAAAREALTFLREDFSEPRRTGPFRVGAFVSDSSSALRLDVATFVNEFLRHLKD